MEIVYDWSHLILRWFHVMGAISWIGSSMYLLYLGRVWQRSEPDIVRAGGSVAATVHWFKRETVLSWASGLLLLVGLYFGTDAVGIVDSVPAVALLVAGWLVYDRLWLGRPAIAAVASALLLVLVIWVASRFHDGRLLYIEIGSLLGTLMAGNAWFRIAPALAPGCEEKAWELARQRSVHNNYLMFPVVVLMVVNHVPSVYASGYGAAILVLLVAAYGIARHVVTGKKARRLALAGVLVLLALMMVLTGG